MVYLLDKGCMTLENTERYAEVLEITNKIIKDVCFMLENRMKSTYFTRRTEKMDFKDLITYALNFAKKSLQFVMALLQENIEKRQKMVDKIMLELQKNTIPIRPNRSYERNMYLKRNKYAQNTKRCL